MEKNTFDSLDPNKQKTPNQPAQPEAIELNEQDLEQISGGHDHGHHGHHRDHDHNHHHCHGHHHHHPRYCCYCYVYY